MSEDKKKIEIRFQWNPWNQNPETFDLNSITEPPCKYCKYWSPKWNATRWGSIPFAGMEFCEAPEMEFDFSCFRGKEIKTNATN